MIRHPSVLARRPPILLKALLALALGAVPAAADAPDWNAVAGVSTVEVVTTDEDGTPRETTVWLAVVDGQGYLRTSETRWAANIERNPDIALRIEEAEYPLRVEYVEDDALRARIDQTFRDKHGFSDALISLFRSSRPKMMRLVAR